VYGGLRLDRTSSAVGVVGVFDDVHSSNGIEAPVMKKGTRYALLCVASAVSLTGFVYNVVQLISGFITPDGFDLGPMLLAAVFLVACFACVGGFIAMIGYKDPLTDVEDEPEWWTKWDRV
jgi:hypothetical protein